MILISLRSTCLTRADKFSGYLDLLDLLVIELNKMHQNIIIGVVFIGLIAFAIIMFYALGFCYQRGLVLMIALRRKRVRVFRAGIVENGQAA